MRHLSLRLVWHDRGWDGCICDNPELNVYCMGQFSVQGDSIREKKELKWEKHNHGKTCLDLWNESKRIPPCTWTINAFSPREMPHVHIHPFFKNAEEKFELLPECSAGTWAMDQMYDPKTRKLVADFDEREENITEYFSQFDEGKSLVFFYLNYDNPINSDDKKYVLVGISMLKKFGPYLGFDGLDNWQMNTAGNRVWSRYVRHNYDKGEGVRIPYQEYLYAGKKPDDLKPITVEITGELARRFKYVSRPLSDDDACELIQRTIEAIRQVKTDSIVPGDWDTRLAWLNRMLGKTWKDRGPYPGMGSVLEVLGMEDGTTFVKEFSAKARETDLRDYIFGELRKKRSEGWAEAIKPLWTEYSELKQKLLYHFCLFDLTYEQIEKIISERREDTEIISSLETILENPYCLSEEYQGEDEDDVIGFYQIDNGLLPHTTLNKIPEIDPDDPRRIRALIVEKLNYEKNSTGNCFLELSDILDYLEKNQVEWRKSSFTPEKIKSKRDYYEKEKLVFFEHDGRIFIYLRPLFDAEDIVRKRITRLVDKQYPNSKVQWKARLTSPHSNIPDNIYQKVLEQQAEAVENSYHRKFTVITGAAGTGKTTVLKTLIQQIKKEKPGSTFLLLAPTGKARENLATKTEMFEETMTIHRALKNHGWLSKRIYRFVENPKNKIEVSNIIIDEASMLDLELLAHLFRAIQWEVVDRLILVGDRHQLPPIGYGRPFFDVMHFLENEHKAVIKNLTINCRQLIQQTNILKLASIYTQTPDKNFESLLNRIEKGEFLGEDLEVYFWNEQTDLNEKILERLGTLIRNEGKESGITNFSVNNLLGIRVGQNRSESQEFYPIDYFQVLTPYRGDYFGTNAINNVFQATFRKSSIDNYGFLEGFTTGDKVIQVVNNTIFNNRIPFEVYNGQLGYVFYVPQAGRKRNSIGVNFPKPGDSQETSIWYSKNKIDSNLELGYAITVHKSQGSEFEIIFLILPREETGLITKELLYTALTRSRKKLVLFLQKDIMPLMSARNNAKSAILFRNTSIFKFRFTSEKYRANDLIHRTSKGEYVRSKSELVIANVLWNSNIFYKYEDPLYSKDGGEWKLPDFTIRTEDDKVFYWEHLGRLENDPQYAEDWEEKKEWYKRNDYFEKLIWSDEIGGFDTKKIEKIIEEKIK